MWSQMSSVYSLQSVFLPHLLGADVRVATGTVPVALHRFGVQRCDDPKVFAHALQQVARDPQMVAHVYSLTGTHLELPLNIRRSRGECQYKTNDRKTILHNVSGWR